ncbi:MAG: InlB B-repeat-containing protein [Clostridia bacterium]|nr:InlB B-repeat-containing protein [Clostridia bacterium]
MKKKYIIIGSCVLAVCLFLAIFGIVYSTMNKPDDTDKTEKYSITYVSEHGTKPENVAEATALPAQLPTVADVEGWHFVGWYTTDNFAEGSEATAGTALSANITLYAKWEAKQVTPPPTEKYSITYVSEHGTKPENVAEATALPAQLPTVSDVDGWHFVGWYTTDNFAEGSEATAGMTLTANITLYANWIPVSAYEQFVSKGNIIYANDFVKAEEVFNSTAIGNFEKYEEAYGKWFGTVNDNDAFDDKNKVFVLNGYLNVVDDSVKTTYAQLILNPVYASVIEVKAVIRVSAVAENWSVFTLMSPYSSSEYLLNLKTNGAKELCLQTRVYDAAEEEYKDSVLPESGGFVYAENKDIVIEATVDLSTGEITVTLSQTGADAKTFNDKIDTQGYEKAGLPLAFSGVQVMTAQSDSRSVGIDWLGARVVSENVEGLKALVLAQLEANYKDYDKSEYTQQLELLEKTYADGVAAIEACTTNAEVLEALNETEEAFYKIKSDSQLEAEAMKETALRELAELKDEYMNSYTIAKDSEDDYFANKEAFDELFENALKNLENSGSVEAVQNEVAYVRNALTGDGWLQNDAAVLESYRQYLVNEARNYGYENGFSDSMAQVEQEIIEPLEEDLADLNTKAEMKALYAEYLELFDSLDTEAQLLAKTKQEACTEIEEYAQLVEANLDENSETDAELIALIESVKDNAILEINNATTIDEVAGIKNAAMDEIGDLAEFVGWNLADAKTALQNYINQKKSNYSQEYALNALDQVWIDHENDFDELTSVAEVIEKLKELKDMVDAITESDITITYSYDDAVDTVTYAFGEEIDRRIQVGDADERFVWLEEDTNQEFDFSSVLPNQSYNLYGQWHDIIKKINEFNRYTYFASALPENNDLIEYTFDGDEISEDYGMAMSGESNENRNIKITLPSKGRISCHIYNFTEESPIAFIDTSINITNTNSSYGTVTLDPASFWAHVGYSFVTLTSIELEAGTYYLNWTGELNIIYIEVFYEAEREIEFTRFIGESHVQYRTGGYWGKVNLNYIWLETTTGEQMNLNCIFNYDPDHSLEYWYYMSDIIAIEVEDYEEFHEGHPEVGRTFDVTISLGKHTRFYFTIEIVEYWFM